MATSGTKSFELDVSDYIEEAFERCGLEVRTGYDVRTARRSLNLLLADWANRGFNRWTLETEVLPLTIDDGEYTLDASTVDIVGAVIRTPDGMDRNITRISREDYLNLPDKTQPGVPHQFYVDRTITPTVKLWPIPNVANYSLVYDRLVRMDDVTKNNESVQIPFRFYPCLTAGLAYYISMKKNPQLTPQLKAIYEEEFLRAAEEDRDRASLFIFPGRGYR